MITLYAIGYSYIATESGDDMGVACFRALALSC